MNELQRVELNMLRCFIEICDKYDLTYYMVCGSALGAVKYSGFIPWDDDIDVAMPRQDYNRFLKKAGCLLPEYYFLQNYHTDPLFPFIHSKIRDSRTTFIEKSVRDLKINHGVYIDIFPLDGYPDNKVESKKLERRIKKLKLRLSSAFPVSDEQKLLTKLFFMSEKILGVSRRTSKYATELDRTVTKYNLNKSKLWCNHGNWQGNLEYAPRAQYGKGIFVEFEGIKVRIPEKYDEYLTQKYGDWRADLPEEEKQGHHYYEICDLSRPYTYYC